MVENLWKKGWIRIAIAMYFIAIVLGAISYGFGIAENGRGFVIWHENPRIGLLANGIALVAIGWTVICGLIEARRYELRQRRMKDDC